MEWEVHRAHTAGEVDAMMGPPAAPGGSMRTIKMLLLSAAALLLVGVVAQQANSQNRANFWFLNNTGKTVQSFYVSPHSQQEWGEDVLGRGTLPEGMGTAVIFPAGVHHICVEDFKLVFSDGTAQTYTDGINVCRVHALEFDESTVSGF